MPFMSILIEFREQDKKSRTWTDWDPCEGTEGLSKAECKALIAEWEVEDAASTFWLKIEYRIVEAA
jgi:hypothetical protein